MFQQGLELASQREYHNEATQAAQNLLQLNEEFDC